MIISLVLFERKNCRLENKWKKNYPVWEKHLLWMKQVSLYDINFQWIFTTCLDFKGLLWKWKLFSKLHNDHFKIFIFVKLYINTEGIKYYFFRLMIPVQDLTPYSKRNLLIKSEKKPSMNLHFQIHWKYMKMGILMYW